MMLSSCSPASASLVPSLFVGGVSSSENNDPRFPSSSSAAVAPYSSSQSWLPQALPQSNNRQQSNNRPPRRQSSSGTSPGASPCSSRRSSLSNAAGVPAAVTAARDAASQAAIETFHNSLTSLATTSIGNIGSFGHDSFSSIDGPQKNGTPSSAPARRRSSQIRRYSSESVRLGKVLGTGSFNDVYEAQFVVSSWSPGDGVHGCDTEEDSDDDFEGDVTYSVEESPQGCEDEYKGIEVSRSCDEHEGQDEHEEDPAALEPRGSYVVKHLKESLVENGGEDDNYSALLTGAHDLAVEATVLSELSHHRNIVGFHGIVGVDLVLERLTCTVTDRMREWRAEERPYRRGALSLTNPQSCRAARREMLRTRLATVAADVAEGMRYMHSAGVMHRDLKPENVGFDSRGIAKIFDFGLAKRFDPADPTSDNSSGGNNKGKRHTGLVGTFRYMAPEVAKCKKYGPAVDVYSFGLVLWELCALDGKAFGRISRTDFQKQVIYGSHRPPVSSSWSSSLQNLMMTCWDGNPNVRPDFASVTAMLERVVEDMSSSSSSVISEDAASASSSQQQQQARPHFPRRRRMSLPEYHPDDDHRHSATIAEEGSSTSSNGSQNDNEGSTPTPTMTTSRPQQQQQQVRRPPSGGGGGGGLFRRRRRHSTHEGPISLTEEEEEDEVALAAAFEAKREGGAAPADSANNNPTPPSSSGRSSSRSSGRRTLLKVARSMSHRL